MQDPNSSPFVTQDASQQEPSERNENSFSSLETHEFSPTIRALFWFSIGLVVLAVIQVPLALISMHTFAEKTFQLTAKSTLSSTHLTVQNIALTAPLIAPVVSTPMVQDPPPILFHVSQLAADSNFEITSTQVNKKNCSLVLNSANITNDESNDLHRILGPLIQNHACSQYERIRIARMRSMRQIKAFEIEVTPGDFWVAVERSLLSFAQEPITSKLRALYEQPEPSLQNHTIPSTWLLRHLIVPVTNKRVGLGFVVSDDLVSSATRAGVDSSLLDAFDDAIHSRSDLSHLGPGTKIRLIANSMYVGGEFDRYDELVALEIQTKNASNPFRLYHLKDSNSRSWFDAKGQQPVQSRWRMPLRFARVTSRFNPHRMHPVLHTVMPHNGCDFGAPAGTPVYSIGSGTIAFHGESGPSGNLVTIQHEHGLESGYAHLSRFAPNLSTGMTIETHTLIGYVGSTGRSTGPHLHLSVKRNGSFIDPLSLKFDAVRVVPRTERDDFHRRKEEVNTELDAISLPALENGSTSKEPSEDSTPLDE